MKAGSDRGLFGPGSVTWRISDEPVMWVAGLRAMYLQALHPRTMRATWQNTAFARPGEAWGRFVRTLEFVRVRTYGSQSEVDRVGRRVRRLHASLTGTDADGSVIRLDEPELLTWVHCGEIGSYVDIAARCGMPLSVGELDRFVAEQRRSAAVVGLESQIVPASMADLAAYFDRMRPSLRVTPEARRAMRASFTIRVPPPLLPLRLIVPPLNVLGYVTLPRWARRLYGTPALGLTEPAVTLALRAAHESTTRIPPRVFLLPAAALMRRERRPAA